MCPIYVGYLIVLFFSSSQTSCSHNFIFSCHFLVIFTPLPKIFTTTCFGRGMHDLINWFQWEATYPVCGDVHSVPNYLEENRKRSIHLLCIVSSEVSVSVVMGVQCIC